MQNGRTERIRVDWPNTVVEALRSRDQRAQNRWTQGVVVSLGKDQMLCFLCFLVADIPYLILLRNDAYEGKTWKAYL